MKHIISQRLKSWLVLNDKKAVELANYMGISAQSLNNKFARGSFSIDDLIRIADFTGSTLSLVNDRGRLDLGADCIREKESKAEKETKIAWDDDCFGIIP